ncbi:hypothetical protein GGF50DRAFT_67968, partial [Schizophyllum commune]
PAMTSPSANPFLGRLEHPGELRTYPPKGPHRFFYATPPTPSSSQRRRPIPPGCRVSKNGYVLRPGEVDFFEEEEKEEEARRRIREAQMIRLARLREERARARDDDERRRILDEHYPLLPEDGTQYWHPGLTTAERNARLERWRERYYNMVVRFRCDPHLYDRYRSHYLPTEGLLDPVHDRAELDKLRRTFSEVIRVLILRLPFTSARSAPAYAMAPRPWVRGNKAVFIKNHQSDFDKCPKRRRGNLYRVLARGMLALAGDRPFDWNHKTDDLVSTEDAPKEVVDNIMSTDGLPEQEVKRRRAKLTKLAGDISAYYRRKRNQQRQRRGIDLERIALLQAGKAKNPISLRITQFYSRRYYHERIKATFEQRFAADVAKWEQKKATAEALGQPFTEKRPAALAVRNKVTNEQWAKETEEFREMVTRMHAEEMEKQRAAARVLLNNDIPTTPQEYDDLYSKAIYYLLPVVNAIALKFGAAVSLFLCAPRPDDGGNIGVFSAHAGETQGPVPLKWPKADEKKFRLVEQFMIEFGQLVFPSKRNANRSPASDDDAEEDEEVEDDEDEQADDEDEDEQPDDEDEEDSFFGDNDVEDDISGAGAAEDDVSGDEEEQEGEEEQDAGIGDACDGAQDVPYEEDGNGAQDDTDMHAVDERGPSALRDGAETSTTKPTPLFLHVSSPAPSEPSSGARDALQEELPPPPSSPAAQSTPVLPIQDLPAASSLTRAAPATSSADTPADTQPAAPHNKSVAGETHEAWTLEAGPNWSDHVAKAIDACRRGMEWGFAFADAVLAYYSYEESRGFRKEGGRKITNTALRPAVYPTWTKLARPYGRPMPLPNVDAHRQEWWAWWKDLMPSVRRLPNGDLMTPAALVHAVKDSGHWEGLDDACGKDGMLQFLLTLLWWGDAIHAHAPHNAKHHADWEVACMDFAGVLNAIVATTTPTKAGK